MRKFTEVAITVCSVVLGFMVGSFIAGVIELDTRLDNPGAQQAVRDSLRTEYTQGTNTWIDGNMTGKESQVELNLVLGGHIFDLHDQIDSMIAQHALDQLYLQNQIWDLKAQVERLDREIPRPEGRRISIYRIEDCGGIPYWDSILYVREYGGKL